MHKVKLTFDDMKLEAVRLPDAKWLVHVHDTGFSDPERTSIKGCAHGEFIVPDDSSMGAIVALCVGGDNYSEDITTALYKIAEPLVKELPLNLRPIP